MPESKTAGIDLGDLSIWSIEYWVLSIEYWVLGIGYWVLSIDWWASRPEEVLAGEGGSPSWSSCWRGPRWSPRTSEQVGKLSKPWDYSSHHQTHPPQANLIFKGNDVLFLRKKNNYLPNINITHRILLSKRTCLTSIMLDCISKSTWSTSPSF